MKVMELSTRKIIEVNDSYGNRLIQHGKAVLPPVARETPKPEKGPGKKGDA